MQVCRAGTFFDERYGEFTISKAMLSEMIDNFQANARGVIPALDYKHESDDVAAGWFKKLYLKDDELWADIEMTPKGLKVLSDKEFGYVSADFETGYQDNETKKKYGCVLMGAGLTNRPVIKRMESVITLSEGNKIMNEDQDLIDELKAEGYTDEEIAAMIEEVDAADDEIELGGPGSGRSGGKGAFSSPERVAKRQERLQKNREAANKFNKRSNAIKKGLKAKQGYANEQAYLRNTREAKNAARKPLSEGDKKMNEEEMKKMQDLEAKCSEYEKQLSEMSVKLAAFEKPVAPEVEEVKPEAEVELAAVKAELAEAKKTITLAEKTSEFVALLSEGKAVEAQRESYIAGDMKSFIEKSVAIKLTEAGVVTTPTEEDAITADQAEDKILSEAIKLSEEKKISMKEAISEVLKNNKKLADKIR